MTMTVGVEVKGATQMQIDSGKGVWERDFIESWPSPPTRTGRQDLSTPSTRVVNLVIQRRHTNLRLLNDAVIEGRFTFVLSFLTTRDGRSLHDFVESDPYMVDLDMEQDSPCRGD
jgi:hypothetical protein